jgi:membrane protease subunit HflK
MSSNKDNNDEKDKKGKRSNPWGNVENIHGQKNDPRRNRPKRSSNTPPDLEKMLKNAQYNFRDSGFNGGPIAIIVVLAALVLWAASGLYIVNPGEHAVIQRFGAWDRTQAQPGLGYHLPIPVETRKIVNVEEIRNLGIGFEAAGRNPASSSKRELPEESLMLTSDRNIIDLHLIIQWNIKSAEDFLFNIYDQEGTIKKVAESAIREIIGQTDMFPVITTGRTGVADRTHKILQDNLDAYKSGVNITQVLIDKAEVHPDVQGAFQDVQSAKQDAEDVQNQAEAYREDILPKARGHAIQMLQQAEAYKQSTVAKADGDADRFNSVYEAYKSGEDVTKERIYIETMEKVLGNANKIILDQNGSNNVVPYLPLEELGATRKGQGR